MSTTPPQHHHSSATVTTDSSWHRQTHCHSTTTNSHSLEATWHNSRARPAAHHQHPQPTTRTHPRKSQQPRNACRLRRSNWAAKRPCGHYYCCTDALGAQSASRMHQQAVQRTTTPVCLSTVTLFPRFFSIAPGTSGDPHTAAQTGRQHSGSANTQARQAGGSCMQSIFLLPPCL